VTTVDSVDRNAVRLAVARRAAELAASESHAAAVRCIDAKAALQRRQHTAEAARTRLEAIREASAARLAGSDARLRRTAAVVNRAQ
jgi:hypothetical protein